ncbi:MAG: hypothetical protein RQ866_08335, partial [Bacteroidales bacterium]|nr:hypothetical protein [Bacteroidales bacterium]
MMKKFLLLFVTIVTFLTMPTIHFGQVNSNTVDDFVFFTSDGAVHDNDSLNSFKKNIIQINLVSLPPLFTNLNQKWIGIEYQRSINRNFSITLMTDLGKFQDYSFTKYHDYFDENQG